MSRGRTRTTATAAALVAMLSLAGRTAQAGSATDTLGVSANVMDTARILSVGDISFSNYDPTEATTPNDASGAVTVRATKNLSYKIYIGSDRTMSDGSNDLDYELYSDASRSSVWGTDSASGEVYTSTSNAASAKTIYGRIAVLQDIPAGNYNDTVTITLEW